MNKVSGARVRTRGVGLGALTMFAMAAVGARVLGARVEDAATGSGGGQVANGASIGPDVMVTAITGVLNYDSATPPGASEPIDAFSISTIACNAGDAALDMIETSNQHAALRQGMFRLKSSCFEQIGTSWVKHVFPASNEPGSCGLVCTNPGAVGSELRPGCTDTSSAGINGDRTNTGRSAEVNAFTGFFPYTIGAVPAEGSIAQRIQVHHSDLNLTQNAGASYFVQAHYVHPGDAAANNGENNATYARVTMRDQGTGTFDARITSPAINHGMTKPAILAWQDADASVRVTNARVPGEGLFILASKAMNVGGGFWHYEYAVENLNSDRSGASFRVPIPAGALVRNLGFHDVDYHSGEPFDNTDWTHSVETDAVTWSTTPYATSANANALRWSTLYNFRFDANVGPAPTTATLGLFKPGVPAAIPIDTLGPALGFMDCNGNGVLDACDVNCAAPGCAPPCGGSPDCNGNGIPDACETDCNGNDIPDDCDVASGASADCDHNGVPDECDPDCDGNGVPDACETMRDSDGDGVNDCIDLCPFTTPPGACLPPALVTCRLGLGFCIANYPRVNCMAQGGTPVCGNPDSCENVPCPASPCRDGCLPGDYDADGDRDLADVAAFQRCYSGASSEPGFSPPGQSCLDSFDFDGDGDVDLIDQARFDLVSDGPRN